LFFKDLVDVVGIDAWDRALGAQLEWDAIRLLAGITVGNINAEGAVVELGALGVEGDSNNG
jgi:hypothetical protein